MGRPDLSYGGLQLPPPENGLYRFERPQAFPACKAVTFRDARNGRVSEPKKIITKLRVNRRHASALQPKGVLVDSNGEKLHLAYCVDRALEHCKVCRASF